MATFVLLARFTHQGITDVKRTVERAEAFRHMAGKVGVTVKDIYWTLGSRDVVVICEAADDEVVSCPECGGILVRTDESGL